MTQDEIRDKIFQIPTQFVESKNELTELQERWVGLIRNIAFKIVKDHGPDYMLNPDLFDIANEINAFFVALKSKK